MKLFIFSVSHLNVCDGLYQVTIYASNPLHPSYSGAYVAKIRVKYDCSYLANEGYFASSKANSSITIWRTGLNSAPESANTLSFKIGDANLFVAGFKFWDSTHFQYSCSKKFEFGCPSSSPVA